MRPEHEADRYREDFEPRMDTDEHGCSRPEHEWIFDDDDGWSPGLSRRSIMEADALTGGGRGSRDEGVAAPTEHDLEFEMDDGQRGTAMNNLQRTTADEIMAG